MTALKLAIIGPGRMGTAVEAVARAAHVDVVAVLDERTPISRESLGGAQVAVEFTNPSSAVANIRACVAVQCPIVVGTTGWYDELPDVSAFVATSGGALLWAANFSLGVAAVSHLVRHAGQLMARLPGFQAAMVETHHSAKLDAPSGTAIMLQKEFTAGSGTDIPVTSVRVGSVPGTHTLILDGAFEQIVVSHEARDRRVFAEGALLAARWLVGRTGVFTLDDVFVGEDVR